MFIFSIYLEKVRDIKLTTLNIATIKNKNLPNSKSLPNS